MIPKIIHFTVPKFVSPQQSAAIERARALHPTWEIRVWQDPVNTDGFLLTHYHAKANSGAQLADLIRLDVVYSHGGVYLDSDVMLHRCLDPLTVLDNFICSEDGSHLTNAVFAASSHNPLIRLLIDYLIEHEPDWNAPPNITTGPLYFSRLWRQERSVNLLPRATFYPYNYDEEPIDPLPLSYGSHQWAGSWLQRKKAKGPKTSLIVHFRRLGELIVRSPLSNLSSRFVDAIASKLPSSRNSYVFGQDLIIRTSRDLLMSLPGSDFFVTPQLVLKDSYEEAALRFVEKTLRGGDFFIDIGCNVGMFAMMAAKRVGPFGRVFAIDASTKVLAHLERSVVMNGYQDRMLIISNFRHAIYRLTPSQLLASNLDRERIGQDVEKANHRFINSLGLTHFVSSQDDNLDDLFSIPQEIKILNISAADSMQVVLAGAVRMIENRCFEFIMVKMRSDISFDEKRLNMCTAEGLIARGYRVGTLSKDGELVMAGSVLASMVEESTIVFART